MLPSWGLKHGRTIIAWHGRLWMLEHSSLHPSLSHLHTHTTFIERPFEPDTFLAFLHSSPFTGNGHPRTQNQALISHCILPFSGFYRALSLSIIHFSCFHLLFNPIIGVHVSVRGCICAWPATASTWSPIARFWSCRVVLWGALAWGWIHRHIDGLLVG
jgi:hypothetical protein